MIFAFMERPWIIVTIISMITQITVQINLSIESYVQPFIVLYKTQLIQFTHYIVEYFALIFLLIAWDRIGPLICRSVLFDYAINLGPNGSCDCEMTSICNVTTSLDVINAAYLHAIRTQIRWKHHSAMVNISVYIQMCTKLPPTHGLIG